MRPLRLFPGCVFLAFILAALVPHDLQAQAVFRTGVDLVHFPVTVEDRRGNLIQDLTADDFEVYENGERQTLRYFATGPGDGSGAPPLRLGLLFDTSGSMRDDVRLARTAAIRFLTTLPEAEDITLVKFDSEVRVARFGSSDFPRLVERLRGREPDGWTALYDAVGIYLDGAAEQDGQKILVLLTDGGDTRSAMRFDEVIRLLRISDVTVFAIGLLEHQPSSSRMEQRLRLQQMASATGGLALFPSSARSLESMYERIRDEIAGRYTLGYVSTNEQQDGTWREVEIRLVRSDLRGARLRSRAGYFAPYSDAAPH